MSAYFVLNCTVTDRAMLDEYLAEVVGSFGVVDIEVVVVDDDSEVIEGTPPGSRTVVLRFRSKNDFRRWYDSPQYRQVLAKRLDATDGFALLVDGT